MKNMYVLGMLAVSFIVGAAPRTVSSSPDIDVVACTGLGFPAVACSTCQTIADIVDDEDLTAECIGCCHETRQATKKYASARLVFDPRYMSEDLHTFIEKKAADFPTLTLEKTRTNQVLLHMSEEGAGTSESDTVSIRRWKMDSIVDYLGEHL